MNIQPSTQISFPDLPEGTVPFLLTDIEGSTQLLQRLHVCKRRSSAIR